MEIFTTLKNLIVNGCSGVSCWSEGQLPPALPQSDTKQQNPRIMVQKKEQSIIIFERNSPCRKIQDKNLGVKKVIQKQIEQNAHELKLARVRDIESLIESEERKSSIIEAKLKNTLVDQALLEAQISHSFKKKKAVAKARSQMNVVQFNMHEELKIMTNSQKKSDQKKYSKRPPLEIVPENKNSVSFAENSVIPDKFSSKTSENFSSNFSGIFGSFDPDIVQSSLLPQFSLDPQLYSNPQVKQQQHDHLSRSSNELEVHQSVQPIDQMNKLLNASVDSIFGEYYEEEQKRKNLSSESDEKNVEWVMDKSPLKIDAKSSFPEVQRRLSQSQKNVLEFFIQERQHSQCQDSVKRMSGIQLKIKKITQNLKSFI